VGIVGIGPRERPRESRRRTADRCSFRHSSCSFLRIPGAEVANLFGPGKRNSARCVSRSRRSESKMPLPWQGRPSLPV
jgi:hypothetical protein